MGVQMETNILDLPKSTWKNNCDQNQTIATTKLGFKKSHLESKNKRVCTTHKHGLQGLSITEKKEVKEVTVVWWGQTPDNHTPVNKTHNESWPCNMSEAADPGRSTLSNQWVLTAWPAAKSKEFKLRKLPRLQLTQEPISTRDSEAWTQNWAGQGTQKKIGTNDKLKEKGRRTGSLRTSPRGVTVAGMMEVLQADWSDCNWKLKVWGGGGGWWGHGGVLVLCGGGVEEGMELSGHVFGMYICMSVPGEEDWGRWTS